MLTGEVPSYFRVSGLIAATCNRALGDHYLDGLTRALPCFSQDGVDKFSGRAGRAGSVLGLQRYHRTILLNRGIFFFFFIEKELELFFPFFLCYFSAEGSAPVLTLAALREERRASRTAAMTEAHVNPKAYPLADRCPPHQRTIRCCSTVLQL